MRWCGRRQRSDPADPAAVELAPADLPDDVLIYTSQEPILPFGRDGGNRRETLRHDATRLRAGGEDQHICPQPP